jgi:hypothetical protein
LRAYCLALAVEPEVLHDFPRRRISRDGNRAAWWRENAPHLIAPKRYLVFHEEVCRI